MTTTPDFGIPYIAGQQAQPEVTHNTALNMLQAILNGVIDRGVNAPPGSPAEGDAYIVGGSPTGAWAGRPNTIAAWFGTAWVFFPGTDDGGSPIAMGARQEGLRVWVRDEDAIYVWTETGSPPALAWVQLVTGGGTPEAGLWTPTIGGTGAAGDFSYNAQDGGYTRIGDLVVLGFDIRVNLETSAPSGNARIFGLPFPPDTSKGLGSMNITTVVNVAAVPSNFAGWTGLLGTSQVDPQMEIRHWSSATAERVTSSSDILGDGFIIIGTAMYFV